MEQTFNFQPGQIYALKSRMTSAIARPLTSINRSSTFRISTSGPTIGFQEVADLERNPENPEDVYSHSYEPWKFDRDFVLVSMPIKNPMFLRSESAIFQLAQNDVMDVYKLIEELGI